jgi:glycosyltransferase involved in cell wall biosynthesis
MTSRTPAVTVVTAVYNTMPYLKRCLRSLVNQTIGVDRLEIIAVDDGSTDGGGEWLDRFAEKHPGLIKVIHQANSGGPAVPSNRGLDAATGRYVFFLGSDDYLGKDALRRLVDTADGLDSDVVLGRMVGVNGRYAHQAIFESDQDDIDLFDSPLPYHLSNTKLFRREMLEKHHIRYPEDLPVGSDQPFTFEACLRARRISVRSGYRFYYSVRRRNARNITYSSGHESKLHYAGKVMDFVAGLVEAGPKRDAVLTRHFDWEISKLLEDRFLAVKPGVQERVRAGIADLADRYLTEAIRLRLPPEPRIRICVAQHGSLGNLVDVIRQDVTRGTPPSVIENGRWYAAYPAFRDSALPDSCFDVTNAVSEWVSRFDLRSARVAPLRGVIALTVASPLADVGEHHQGPIKLRAGLVHGIVTATGTDADGSWVRAEFPLAEIVRKRGSGGRHVWVEGAGFGAARDTVVRAPGDVLAKPIRGFSIGHAYMITISKNDRGQLLIGGTRITPRKVMARLRRGLPTRRGK